MQSMPGEVKNPIPPCAAFAVIIRGPKHNPTVGVELGDQLEPTWLQYPGHGPRIVGWITQNLKARVGRIADHQVHALFIVGRQPRLHLQSPPGKHQTGTQGQYRSQGHRNALHLHSFCWSRSLRCHRKDIGGPYHKTERGTKIG